MSYMNRQQRRALRNRLVSAAWGLRIEYTDGEVDLTAFGSEADARVAFRVALDVKADEPDGILRVVLLHEGLEVESSDVGVPP